MTKAERLELQKQKLVEMKAHEDELRAQGIKYVAGIDEVGRGPLAGPVYAACVILPADFDEPGVNDSKKLSAKRREELDAIIKERAIAYGIGIVDNHEIDEVNILNATKHAMKIAIANAEDKLPGGEHIGRLLIDAVKLDVDIEQESIIKGDEKCLSIAAASIVAKVARDAFMTEMDEQYPGYDFAGNKGYGTAKHYEGLREYGITAIHRRTFLKKFEETEMANKVYAVRKGRTTGILMNWDDCKKSVDGFSGAEYKSFADMQDAVAYLQGADASVTSGTGAGIETSGAAESTTGRGSNSENAQRGYAAFVDGSYNVATGGYAGAAVMLRDGEIIAELSQAYNDEQSGLRNVAGEIMGARMAIDYCIENDIPEITIFHDYEGVGKWANAEWKANLPMTKDYRDYVAEARNQITVNFSKVDAHTGDKYNERADFLAKKALQG